MGPKGVCIYIATVSTATPPKGDSKNAFRGERPGVPIGEIPGVA